MQIYYYNNYLISINMFHYNFIIQHYISYTDNCHTMKRTVEQLPL